MKKYLFLLSFIASANFFDAQAQLSPLYELNQTDSAWVFLKINLQDCSIDTLSSFPFTQFGFKDNEFRGFAAGCNCYYTIATNIIQSGIGKLSLTDGSLSIIPVAFDTMLPIEIEYNPLDNCIYSVSEANTNNNGCYLCKIDLGNGTQTIISHLPDYSCYWGSAYDLNTISSANNKYYCYTDSGFTAIDLTTGLWTPIHLTFGGNGVFCDNALNKIFSVGVDSLGQEGIYEYDLATGVQNLIVNISSYSDAQNSYDPILHNYTKADELGGLDCELITYNVITGMMIDSCVSSLYFPPIYDMCYPSAASSLSFENNISIYPNPFTEDFQLSITGAETDAKVSIYNIIGQQQAHLTIIHSKSIHQTLSLRNYSAGVYLVSITVNGQRFMRKVVKQ